MFVRLIALACIAAFCQAQTKIVFEVASVRSAPPAGPGIVRGTRGGPGTPDPEQFTATNSILRNLLLMAYGLNNDQVSGPPWMDTEQYSIVAKIPLGTTRERFQMMLRNLLTDRFHIDARMVKKDFTAYEMTVAKGGLKMKESVVDPSPTPSARPFELPVITALTFKDGFPELAPGNSPALRGINVNGRELITARQQTIEGIMRTLQNALGAGTRVEDKTGLAGKYDYHFQYARDNANAIAAALAQPLPAGAGFLDSIGEPVPDVITAAQQQLGLRLEKGKISLDMLVIDHADKVPTEN